MREILFRGKADDTGEWIFGSFVPSIAEAEDSLFDIDGYIEKYNSETSKYEKSLVNRDTVGQYIGLQDETREKIFEGDIIEYYHLLNNAKVRTTVEYENYSGWLPFTEEFGPYHESVKIIGNIHDNPELLKEKL